MKNPKTQRFLSLALPLILFGLALLFRLDGISWGLPNAARWYSLHPDERQTVAAVLNLDFLSGDFNPNFFNYPSLYLYLTYLAHFLMGGFGWTQIITPQNAQWAIPHDILLAGRFVSALLGAATILPVYDMARRLFTPRFSGLAAFAMAMAPAAVQHSHFATVDISATFFVALALMFSVRALASPPREYSQNETVAKIAMPTKNAKIVAADEVDVREYSQRNLTRDLILAALFSGLAAATKYNAVLVFIAPLVAWYLLRDGTRRPPVNERAAVESPVNGAEETASETQTRRSPVHGAFSKTQLARSRAGIARRDAAKNAAVKSALHSTPLRVLVLLFGALLLGFFIGCPFSVFSFREFWGDGQNNGFAYELFVHSRQGSGEVFLRTGNGWIYHLTENLPFALGLPLMLLCLLGVFVAARAALTTREYSQNSATETNNAAGVSQKTAAPKTRSHASTSKNAAGVSPPNTAPASPKNADFSMNENPSREYSRARASLPLLAFGVLYFLAIGFSQVRFMRYDLPLIPALCVFVAAGFAALSRFLAQQLSRMETPRESFSFAIERVLRMVFLLAFFMAALGVNAPLLSSDTRDDAAAWLNKNAPQKATVALAADKIWFTSPPLSPQDAPPGSGVDNVAAFAKQSRYQLSALDFNSRRLSEEKPRYVVMNEFDWRDKARLADKDYRDFMDVLNREYSPPQVFSPPTPLLPGRDFAPHDFLYTWPQTRVYVRREPR